jgi:hypothetical protein
MGDSSLPSGPVCDCGSLVLPLGAITVCIDNVEHSDTACIPCPAVRP